ncbi:MAG: chloride channel protein [Desulfobacterales bacterium]|nr:chloride channel protein [Desulfobacterales bacterium]
MRFPISWRTPSTWRLFRSDDRLLMILCGAFVGVCSGLAAVALSRSLLAMLSWLAPYRQYGWAFLLPALGAALSTLFLNKIVKEGAGHGVPEVIYSVSRYGGLLRLRSSFSRLVSSFLTIGSGGSAGPEAPVVMSGSAIGSNIARLFNLNDRQRVVLVGCGAAGAISAIFNAPIAGMVFSVEVILGEWAAANLIPIAIAAVAGTQTSHFLQGKQIPFAHRQFDIAPLDILACIGLALFTAVASILLTRAIRAVHHRSDRLRLPVWLKAALGGCAVGLIGLYMPLVLGEGYHAIETMIAGHFTTGIALVLLACLAKILATALTLGSGGSGGIFAPSLVIGSFTGLAYHRLLTLIWPHVGWVPEGCFALLGMAGLVSGILQAPLTGIFLIVDVTGGYDVILPLIVVSAVSATLCHYMEPASFYLKDLVERGQLMRPGTDARVLADLEVHELLETDCITVPADMLLRDFVEVVKRSRRNLFPVEDEASGKFVGLIDMASVRPYLFDPLMYDAVLVGQLMNTQVETAAPDEDVAEVLSRMDAGNLYNMPVVANHRFVGMVSKSSLLDQYRNELMVQTHHLNR